MYDIQHITLEVDNKKMCLWQINIGTRNDELKFMPIKQGMGAWLVSLVF